jgi:hypothetical protein
VNEGRFPKQIFWQVDGGSENANKFCLMICELLIARTGIEEILLTRLPVGHTHEDIDARFGTIWKATRNQTLLSPQAYERMLRETFKQDKSHRFDVIDVFVIPDYKSFFENHYYAPENWSRGKYTNHQFKFDRPPLEDRHLFPLNVRIQYRMYCADEYVEIDEVSALPLDRRSPDGILLGYQAYKKGVFWAPAAKLDRPVRGMYILKSLPTDLFVMQNFCAGSRERLVAVADSVSAHFKPNDLRTHEPSTEWSNFLRLAPQSNKVNEFTAHKPPHIPFASILLGFETVADAGSSVAPGGSAMSAPLIAFAGENIKWDQSRNPERPTLWIPNNSVAIVPELDISVILKMHQPEIVKRIERVNIDYGMQIKTKQRKEALAEALRVAYSMIARSESAAAAAAATATVVPVRASDAPGRAVRVKIEGELPAAKIKDMMRVYNASQPDKSKQFKGIQGMLAEVAREQWAAHARSLDVAGVERDPKRQKVADSASDLAAAERVVLGDDEVDGEFQEEERGKKAK